MPNCFLCEKELSYCKYDDNISGYWYCDTPGDYTKYYAPISTDLKLLNYNSAILNFHWYLHGFHFSMNEYGTHYNIDDLLIFHKESYYIYYSILKYKNNMPQKIKIPAFAFKNESELRSKLNKYLMLI